MMSREIFGAQNPTEENGGFSDEIDKIGSGCYGKVYRLKKDSGDFDAVKVLEIPFETITKLIIDNNELEKLLYFKHKNVIPLYDWWSKMIINIDEVSFNCLKDSFESLVQDHARLRSVAVYIRMPLRPMTLKMWTKEFKEYEEKDRSLDGFVKFRTAIIKQFKQHLKNNKNSSDSEVSDVENDKKAKSIENIMENCDHNEMIFNIFYQLLKGLQFLHTNGITHGDLHPGNIFIGYDEIGELHVELGDFGLACEFSIRSTDVLSTNPDYASQDQLNGLRHPKVN